MQKLLIGSCLLAYGFGLSAPLPARSTPAPSALIAPADSAAAWKNYVGRGDFAGYYAALEALLAKAEQSVPGEESERTQALLKDPAYLRALSLRELLRLTGVENMAKLAATPDGLNFLKAFLGDGAWLEIYLNSGPLPENSAAGLEALRDIWLTDRSAQSPQNRDLATATALVFTTDPTKSTLRQLMTRDEKPLTPAQRYAFFKKSREEGKLRPSFENLKAWELRWVVAAPVDNTALEWMQKNVNLPIDQFDDACWIPRYRGVNDFGDTIQGPLFYAPSRASMNWAEDVAANGGVCGSLSTFGAVNAMARGVPATTQGQPGHCAYIFRPARGQWRGGFGGGDGGPHNSMWGSPNAYVHLADAAFSGEEAMAASQRLAWRARRLLEKGDKNAARANFDLALQAQPLNMPVWREAIALNQGDAAFSASDWQNFAERLLSGMKAHPKPLCDLLARFESKNLWPGLDAAARKAWFTRLHEAIAANQHLGWTPWNMAGEVYGAQAKALGAEGASFFGAALTPYVKANHEFLLGQMIDWGTENLAKTPDGKEKFFASLGAALQAADGGGANEKTQRKLLGDAIRATEAARSAEGFQSLSDAAAKFASNEGNLKLETPGGTLVSARGLIYFSGTDGYDNPASHRGVLTENGGFFHAQPAKEGKDKRPFAVVQLPATYKITGLALANRLSNQWRAKALRVSTSTDEKTWIPLVEISDFKQQWKADVRAKNVKARWIKVENLTESDAFHLRNICIYGEAP